MFKYVICNHSLILYSFLHIFFKTIAQTSISFSSLFHATYIFFCSDLFLLPLSHSSIKSRFFFLTRFSLRLFLYIQRNFVFWFPLISPEQVWHIPSGPSPFRNTPVRFHPIFFTYSVGKVSYLPWVGRPLPLGVKPCWFRAGTIM